MQGAEGMRVMDSSESAGSQIAKWIMHQYLFRPRAEGSVPEKLYTQVNCVRLAMFGLFFGRWSEGIMNAKKVIELKITVLNDSLERMPRPANRAHFLPSSPSMELKLPEPLNYV